MSSEKERVLQYLLEHIDSHDKDCVKKTVENFGLSKSTVYNYIKELEKNNIILKGENHSRYILKKERFTFTYINDNSLMEHRIYDNDIAPLLETLDKNVLSIWRYAFCEMMNNAIEHSAADTISCIVTKDALKTEIAIEDNGIGIFRNIQKFIKETKNEDYSLEESASLLLAGKFTTAKQFHSGEGIFFTSHIMDRFTIYSDGVLFTRDIVKSDMMNIEGLGNSTCVIMSLSNRSRKILKSIFDEFSDVDEGFFKTQIPLIHMFQSGYPVSRSEARRLGEMILNFREIILDFSYIEDIGQAFAHELFVLWQGNNPDKKIVIQNANENVDFMIKRVIRTAQG